MRVRRRRRRCHHLGDDVPRNKERAVEGTAQVDQMAGRRVWLRCELFAVDERECCF